MSEAPRQYQALMHPLLSYPPHNTYWKKIQQINNDNDILNILKLVYESYAGYTAWQLREKTHIAGGPWQITVDTKGMQKEIDKKLIKTYFKNNIVRVND